MLTTAPPTGAPVPTLRSLPWYQHRDERLPCRAQDGELWFADDPAELELAKALCGDCPVRAACLAGALERMEPWGVWGGELFARGVVVPRKRPRGRPRKDAEAA
jgi:WhiB family redox-sensing transcriptional regulator